jgi:hypothetical protein
MVFLLFRATREEKQRTKVSQEDREVMLNEIGSRIIKKQHKFHFLGGVGRRCRFY